MSRSFLIVALSVICVGCHQGSSTVSSPSTPPPTPGATQATTNPPPPPDAPAAGPATSTPEASSTPVAANAPLQVPNELKGSGYDYYGLANDQPVDLELTMDDNQVKTGSQTTVLKAVRDGKATFEQTRTGGLDQLGHDELVLSKDGIHVTNSSIAKVDPTNLEFPFDPQPGFTWTSHDKIDDPGQHFDVTSKLVVEGFKDVDTKGGRKHALLVTSSGKGTQNGVPVRIDTQTYYVKGFGVVKQVIDTTAGGKHSRITQQISH